MVQLQQTAARRGSKLYRSNHVAALVSSKDAAALAEELLHKQEHNLELQQQLKCLLTEKRHLEVELSSSRNALIRVMQHPGPIQQQLQDQVPCAAGDECAVLSFHQQSCLLGTLQEQDAALQETQQQVAYEQALTGHLYCVLEQVRAAAEAAASDDSSTGGRLSQELLTILEAFQFPAVAPCAPRTPVSSLAVAQEAHKVLLQQVLLLRGKLAVPAPVHTVGPASALSGCPAGPRPMSASSGRAAHTSSSSSQARKAQELLAFMQSHVQRLQDLLYSVAGPLAASSPHTHLQPQQAEQQSQQSLGPSSQDPQSESVFSVPARPGAAVSGRASRGFYSGVRPQTASVRSVSCSSSARPLSAAAGLSRTPGWTKWQSSSLSAVPEGPSVSRPASKHPASMPDLTPYLTFPPRRPGSPNALAAYRACPRQATQNAGGISSSGAAAAAAAAAEAAQLVQELQEALTDRECLIQLLQQQQDQLQGQLQAAGEDLAALQQQLDVSQQAVGALQAQAVAAAEGNTVLQDELHAAQQAAAMVQEELQQQQQQRQELQQELQRLQEAQAGSRAEVQAQEAIKQQALLAEQEAAAAAAAAHNSQLLALQQQLSDAQVQELQHQLHQQQVQHIQAEQVWTQQLDEAAAAAAAAATSLPVVPSTVVEEESASSKRAQLLQLAQWLADGVAGMQPAQALLTEAGDLQDDVVPLCGALQQLVHSLKQVVREQLSGSTLPQAARSTGSTAQLEGHLEETATEVQQCMDMLQEVVASARRASEMGLPGLEYASIKRFSQLDTEWQTVPAAGERVSSGRLSE